MALTRKLLKSLGLEEAAIDTIIDAHTETTDALKKERDTAREEAGKIGDLTRQLNDANDKLAKAGDAAKVQADFDAYKQEVAAEKKAAKTDADVRAILKDAGIARASFIDAVANSYDRSKLVYDEDGKITNRAELVTAAKTDYADFVASTANVGIPPVATPVASGSSQMSKKDIFAITNNQARQKAIAENIRLFRKEG